MFKTKEVLNFQSRKNKGFTLTEMVIVIAVIAVLAAVLIPTFIGIANSANERADLSTAANATSVVKSTSGALNSMQGIYDALVADNYDITTTKVANAHFAWEATTQQFILVKENLELKANNDSTLNNANLELWFFVKDNSFIISKDSLNNKTFSVNYFLCNDYSGSFNFNTLSSFDTGNSTLTGNVNYGSATEQITTTADITINGTIVGNVVVNAPNADITQTGTISTINAYAVASNSLNIKGRVGNVHIEKGKLAVSNGAYITNVTVPASTTNSINIVNNGFISTVAPKTGTADLPQSVSVDNTNGVIVTSTGFTPAANKTTISITSLADLENFRDEVNAGNTFENLTVEVNVTGNTINLPAGWTPIGAFSRETHNVKTGGSKSFSGTFDGNGVTINGLNNNGYTPSNTTTGSNATTLAGKLEYAYGFFGVVTNATITDIKFTNVNINIPTGTTIYGDSVGAVVGFASGNFSISNIEVNGSISAYDAVGGIVGRIYQPMTVSIVNCVNKANVAGQAKIAGIVGFIGSVIKTANTENTVRIEGCSNQGAVASKMVLADTAKVVCAGGIVGYEGNAKLASGQTYNIDIITCSNSGAVSVEFDVAGNSTTSLFADQIVGHQDTNTHIYETGSTETGTAQVLAD